MINNNCIYSNPKIPPNYYYAKLIEVKTDESYDNEFPKILARLEILPAQGIPENTIFYAIIHPTPNSKFHCQNFRNTFPIWDDRNYSPALGQIGSIKVYDAVYKGAQYSAVQFVLQPQQVIRRINEIYRELGIEELGQ